MLEWDDSKKILYAYQNALARPKLIPDEEESVVYKSFKNYCNKQVSKDVMEVFLEKLKDVIRIEPSIGIYDGSIKARRVDPGFFNDLSTHLTVEFNVPGFERPKTQNDVTIMQIPTVNENGIIDYNGAQYAFIHMLEQESTISFETNDTNSNPQELKIRSGMRNIMIEDNVTALRIKFSDLKGKSSLIKYNLMNLIVAMAEEEGYDPKKIFDEYSNFFIINMFRDRFEKERCLGGVFDSKNNVNGIDYKEKLVSRLMLTRIKENGTGDTSYNNSLVRDNLNELLSLDRAIGEILYADVRSELDPDKVLANAGDVITLNMVELFKANGVYKVYVKYKPNIEGYYLAETIFVNKAPAGLRITDSLREYFPEESGMYTSRYYDTLPQCIIYEEGTALTVNILNALEAFGYEEILVKERVNSPRTKVLRFYEEIISNRQVRGSYIGKNNNTWYYLNADNVYKEADGSYTTYDLVALQSFCVKLFQGKWIDRVVNADAGFRKVLIPLEEQYHRAFCFAVREGFKQMNRKFKEIYRGSKENFLDRDLIDNQFFPFTKNFWRYLRDEAKCITRLQTDNVHNPLAYQSACTKVNVYTANKHSVADSQREIAIGSYGKIDAYEIPQSGKLGTVNNSCCGTVIDTNGNISTKYYKLAHMGTKTRVLTDQIVTLTSREEEQYVIADICSLNLDSNNIVQDNTQFVQCRVPTRNSIEKSTFAYRPISQVNYVNVDANQTLSWGCATIPSMCCNDAARAIFAIAQMKQAKGLCVSEEPDVITSAYEQFAWLNNKFGIIARCSGVVLSCLYDWKNNVYHLAVVYGVNEIPTNLEAIPEEDKQIYDFAEYFDSGYSVTKLNILVQEGDRFERGQMLVSSNFISENGILKMGVNALVGYICDGYNYEDGAHMSQSLCDRLGSYRVNTEKFEGSMKSSSGYNIKNIPVSRWISPEEGTEVGISYKNSNNYDMTTNKTSRLKKAYGFYESKVPLVAEHKKSNYGMALNTISVDPFHPGDKSSNRHGNKGVLSIVEKNANMPRLMNGMPLDICLNPLGVGSRMNIGQVKETQCGLVAHVGGYKLSADSYNGITEKEIADLMSLTVDLMNSGGDFDSAFSSNSALLSGIKNADLFKKHLINNMSNILVYAGCFNKRGTTKVMLPVNDGKYTETEILVGYIHIFKLIQESHKKIHARGGLNISEPYSAVADSPTHGSSAGGGQRFGTMEIDALCAYGVAKYIHELTNERCDNAIARDNFNVDTYFPQVIKKEYTINPGKDLKPDGQRRAVTQFLYSMLALGVMCEPNDNEFIPLSKNNGEELAHWNPSVIQRAKAPSRPKKKDNEDKTLHGEDLGTSMVDYANHSAGYSSSDSKEDEAKSARDLILGNFMEDM